MAQNLRDDHPRGPEPNPNPGPEPRPKRGPTQGPPGSPPTEIHLVRAIKQRWKELGGEAWAQPDAELGGSFSLGDGRGYMAQFFLNKDQSLVAIVWSAKTGARLVVPLLGGPWNSRGGERGLLGYPTSDPL